MSKRIKVKFIPMGDQIKCMFYGKIICTEQPDTVYPKTCTLSRNDYTFLKIFGNKSKVKSFMKKGRPVNKVIQMKDMNSGWFHFHECERVV